MSSMNVSSADSTNSCTESVEWYLNQVRGVSESEASDADLISCVQFNKDGEMLAVGDKGGRITLLKRHSTYNEVLEQHRTEYNLYTTFTSHEAEFDYLKSLEIEEKINKIRWLPYKHQNSQFLLSTNDKTIKLWRIRERFRREPAMLNFDSDLSTSSIEEKRSHILSQGFVKLPRPTSRILQLYQNGDTSPLHRPTTFAPPQGAFEVDTTAKQVYANAHAYHINSLSVNSDQETFLSSDDLRINLWHLSRADQSFNIVDLKPVNMEDLTEVITAAEFHPKQCNLFAYSSSKGTISLCDMRKNALCDKNVVSFSEPDDPSNRSFFSEIINSISDMSFSSTGDYILIRDYLTLKVWDMRCSSKPVECYRVHEYFRNKLCSLYENDCIFDKFECCWSPDDRYVMTGSYNNFVRIFDRVTSTDVSLEPTRDPMRSLNQPLVNRRVVTSQFQHGNAATYFNEHGNEVHVDSLDISSKLLHVHWNPCGSEAAASASHTLFLLSEKRRTFSDPSTLMGADSSGAEGDARREDGRLSWSIETEEDGGESEYRATNTPMEID